MSKPKDGPKSRVGPVAAIILLTIVGGCVFGVVSLVRHFQKTRLVWATLPIDGPTLSDRWVELVRSGRFDEALPDCSTAFQARLDAKLRETLTATIKQLPTSPVPAGRTFTKGLNRFTAGVGRGPFIDIQSQSPVLIYRLMLSNDPAKPEELVVTSIVENGRVVIDNVEAKPPIPASQPPPANPLVSIPPPPEEPKGPKAEKVTTQESIPTPR